MDPEAAAVPHNLSTNTTVQIDGADIVLVTNVHL